MFERAVRASSRRRTVRAAWAALFGRSPEYLGTDLLHDATAPRRYITIDRWTSSEAFDKFREMHATEYGALDARCEAWTEEEAKIGTWTVTT